MKIDSKDATVRSLLKSSYYFIPRFQRPYSWDRENVEDLWEDAIVDNPGDYFIGSMVVYPKDSDTFAVVDGQQRLTTITLLLCAIRDAFSRYGFDNLATGTQNFIERPDEDDQRHFVLQTETSFPYLQDEILKLEDPELDAKVGSEERALKDAFDRLRGKITSKIESIEVDTTLAKEKKPAKIRSELQVIREAILGLKVIFIEVDNQDNATVIFETLNTRGKDLTVADLVKTHLLNHLKGRNAGLDTPRQKWDGIRATFDASPSAPDMSAFLLAVWQSRYEYVNEKKLYKSVKERIRRRDAAAFLNLLVADAEQYRQIVEPGYRKWQREAAGPADSLRFLQDFRLRQPMPFLLSLLREYDGGRITLRQLTRGLGAVERFHFAYTVVASKSSSGGMSFMYARLARELLNARNKIAKNLVIDELEAKLSERFPAEGEFTESFAELGYAHGSTPQAKRTVQYVLKELYRHHRPGQVVDFSRMTIEHLAPQNPSDGVTAEHTASLGNLIYVDQKLNGALANGDFAAKKQALLRQTNVWVPEEILRATAWTDDEIRARTARMAKTAYTDVWAM